MGRWMLMILCLCSVSVMAQYPGYKPLTNTEDFRQQFTKAAQATQSIQCDFVQEKNLILFSDEVYRESEYDPATRLPAACDYGEHAVSLGVTSKTYGLAGLRIGWIATKNKKVYESMASLKDYTTICNSAPSEFLAEVAMRNRQKLIDRSLAIIKHNLTIVDKLFASHSSLFTWVRPKAGSMGFPKLLKGDVEVFCDDLVRKAGVLLLPGTMYDESKNHFRLGLGRKNLAQAVGRLEVYLSEK